MNAMKKLTLCILAVFMLTAAVFGLSACDDETPEECTHEWGDWEVVTPSTCLVAGVETRVCKLDETHTEERASALAAHTFTTYISNNDATCTEDGTKTATCDLEGCTATDIISDFGSMIPHTYDKMLAEEEYLKAPASCSVKATYYYSCECGAYGTNTFEVGEFSHSFATEWSYDEANHWHACQCGQTADVTAHVWNIVAVKVEPTCTEQGSADYTCECGATKTETIPPTHELKHTEKKEATCSDAGNIEYWQCEDCSKYFSKEDASVEITLADTVIAIKPHDFENGIWLYTADGHSKKCASCAAATASESHNLSDKRDPDKHWEECECGYTVNAEDHNLNPDTSETAHWFECSCGFIGVEHAHEKDSLLEVLTPANCESDGEAKYKCDCGREFTAAIPAAHTLNHTPAKAASCVADGNIEYWLCEVCFNYFSDSDATVEIASVDTVIYATGHDFAHGELKRDETGHWASCASCGESDSTTIEEHSFADKSDSDYHWKECQTCSYIADKSRHEMIVYTNANQHYSKCSCGYDTEKVNHIWESEVTTDKTCTVDEVTTYTCECGEQRTVITAIASHNLTYTAPVERTCENGGRTEYWHCSDCEKFFSDEKALKEINYADTEIDGGHDFEKGGWIYNGTSHAQKCYWCDTTTEWVEHTLETYAANATHHWIGCQCGYISEGEKAEHAYVYTDHGTYHEYTCETCSYQSGQIEHNMEYKKTADEHWTECVCGVATDKQAHSFTAGFNTAYHYDECECGHTVSQAEHNFEVRCTIYQHWYVCADCDYETEKHNHSFETLFDTIQHWQECDCGYSTQKVNHSLEPMTDGVFHWTECDCGYNTEKVKKNEE